MMKPVLSAVICLLLSGFLNAQDGPKSGFKGYTKLANKSYLKYLQKSNGTTVTETGGALFIKILFITENDSVFIDVNKEAQTPSYPMRMDSAEYAGDFLDVLSKLHVGDSVKVFMSLDSLKKYYPDEFVFEEQWDSMEYLGMAVKVDSMYSRQKTMQLQAQAAAEREAAYKQLVYDDSVKLALYLSLNKYPDKPDYNGIWYRTLKEGSGEQVKGGDEVSITYKYSHAEGKVISDSTFTYIIGEVEMIEGWKIGVARMRKGEKAIWIIPSELAYQDGHTIIFEVKLLDIEHK